jgi:hypothetical protein
MSASSNITDTGLFTVGMITGVFGLQLSEMDIILGIVLKIVSIISFVILGIYNIKKYKHLTKEIKKINEKDDDI